MFEDRGDLLAQPQVVGFDQLGGGMRVAAAARGEDVGVIAAGVLACQPAEVQDVEPADLRHEPIDRADELVVARGGEQDAVERVVELDGGDHVPLAERPRAIAVQRRHAPVVGLAQAGHAEPCPERLERRDHREGLRRALGADRRDAGLAVRDGLNQPLGLQALERLAHRHAAGLELLGQVGVADPGTRRQCSGDDRPHENVVGAVGQ